MARLAYDPETRRLRLVDEDDGSPPCSTTTEPVRVKSVSVSQLNTFKACKRRWFFQKVRGVRVPTDHKKGAATGTEIHSLHDVYYKKGELPSADHPHYRKVLASLENLPKRGDDVISEMPFSVPLPTGIPFTGVIDLVDRTYLPDDLFITDHKSTGDISRLEQNPVDVVNDPQMLTYAHVGYTLFNATRVRVSHNTISSKHVARILPPQYVYVSRQKAQENWVDQIETTGTMIRLAASPPADWNDVEPTTEACGDYGGCDFLPICTLKTPTLGVPQMAHDNDAASDLLKRLQAAVANVAPAPAPMPSAAPVVMEAPAELAETNEIRLLPPDAPSRKTPLEEPKEEVKATKKGRPKKAAAEPEAEPQRWEYMIDKMITTVDELQDALERYGEQGWEFVTFFDGIYAVFKRPKQS